MGTSAECTVQFRLRQNALHVKTLTMHAWQKATPFLNTTFQFSRVRSRRCSLGEVAIKRTRRTVTATWIPSIVECGTCKTQHAENTTCPRCTQQAIDKFRNLEVDAACLPSYDRPVFTPITLASSLQELAKEPSSSRERTEILRVYNRLTEGRNA